MEPAVTTQHTHPNTVLHCLYGYYNMGYPRKKLARIYHKDVKTIGNWIHVYETTGTFQRVNRADNKFTKPQRNWLIIHEFGLTWKVLERRVFHIKEKDIFRFVRDISQVNWTHHNIVFLDEVSFDNRGMIRRRGYSMRWQKAAIRGDYQRKPRVSILAFAGVNGIIDYYDTGNGKVRLYPGPNSIWILDGAAIHRHPEIVHFLRSIGIVPIFLPAYCPFFNPIEYLFGYIKKSFQRHYVETSSTELTPFIARTFSRFTSFNMSKVFEHCGWTVQGYFDPVRQLSKENRVRTAENTEHPETHVFEEDILEFVVRHH
ncbi:hypothetical protein PHMEG_00035241 [Phytophthora megakarya]|uniref:Tc1-like transposase DDE domain-containing protein n=1 Tax=Phytophthora megakarya TaxID=4795 RepID=A0A225UPN9_9STRA|nr:hypothetical protein PHMEG_00035241 [Phytophthora megakarya]